MRFEYIILVYDIKIVIEYESIDIIFFAVILGYSLIFDEKKTTDQPVIKDSNFVYVDRPANMQISDSVMIYRDQTASVL